MKKFDVSNLIKCRIRVCAAVLLIPVWLSNLALTDAYISVYIILSIAGLWTCLENSKYPNDISWIEKISILILSLVFSVSVIAANYTLFFPQGDTSGLLPSDRVMFVVDLLLSFFGGIILAWNLLVYFIHKFPCLSTSVRKRTNYKFVFLTSFAVIALIYSANLFLVEYPGNILIDSNYQINQGYVNHYINDHPFWHTKLINILLRIGYFVFGEINAAAAFYCFVQIILMALCFAYCVVTLYQAGLPSVCVAGCLGLFALMPYNIIFADSMIKDVLFSGAALVIVVSIYRILKDVGNCRWLNYVLLGIGSFSFCLLRTNGLLAFFVFSIICVPGLFRNNKKLIGVIFAVLVVGFLLTGPVLDLLHVDSPSITEAFSLPLQQLARVICDGKDLTEDEIALLSRIYDIEEIPQIYQSWWADPIKFEIRSNNVEFFENNLGEYIRLWLDLGRKHPDSYLKAWIDQTRGYWNGGYFYHLYNQMVSENPYGIVRAEQSNVISLLADYYYALTRHLIYFEPLHSIGLHVWAVGVCCFINALKRRREWMLSVLPLVIIGGLLLGTPVFAEFRYAYPIFTTYYFIISVSVFDCKIKVDSDSCLVSAE